MSHRSELLDQYLCKRVQIYFKDGTTDIGILQFVADDPRLIKRLIYKNYYCLEINNRNISHLVFSKSTVKKVNEI